MEPTFASLLTPAGILIAAGFITTVVSILKTVPWLDRNISGALLATGVSLALYLATAAVLDGGPDAYLSCAFAWASCAATSIGIKAAAVHVENVRNGVAGIAPEITPLSHTEDDESDLVLGDLPTEDVVPVKPEG